MQPDQTDFVRDCCHVARQIPGKRLINAGPPEMIIIVNLHIDVSLPVVEIKGPPPTLVLDLAAPFF